MFLRAMLPYFAAADAADPIRTAQAEFIIAWSRGLPGRLAAYCTRVRGLLIDRGEEITIESLRMVNMVTEVDMERSKAVSDGRPPNLGTVATKKALPAQAKGLVKKERHSVPSKAKAAEKRASVK